MYVLNLCCLMPSRASLSDYALSGNNAEAFNIIEANATIQSGANLTFVFVPDFTEDPTVQVNLDAARTNAFYLANKMHDISYRYGFTEASFNFQTNNFGLSGKGNDRVTISVQDSAGIDNADFATPPEYVRLIRLTHSETKALCQRPVRTNAHVLVGFHQSRML